MSAIPSPVSSDNPPKKSKSTVVRKSTRKSKSIQTAIIARRVHGQSKAQIARETGLAVNTVTSIIELSDVERQIAEYRADTLAICPDAIIAVGNQVRAGDGDLGLKLLERAGVIGEDAIDSIRRHSQRQAGAINVLVQSGATLHIDDAHGNHNVPLSDATTICSNKDNGENNCTSTINDKVTDTHGTPTGKHPKAAPTHQ